MSKERLALGLQSCLGNLWKENDFSDVTIVVEDTPFRCHRVILSACSRVIQEMFHGDSTYNIKVTGVSEKTFEIILKCVYTGEADFTVDNIFDIWSAAELLQIGYLAKECQSFTIENTDVDNCCKILTHARMCSAENVIEHSLEFIAKHFDQFRNTEYFLQLPFDYLHKIITNDCLTISSESLVVDTIFNWVEYTPDGTDRLQASGENSYMNNTMKTGNYASFNDDSTRIMFVKSDSEKNNTVISHDTPDSTTHKVSDTYAVGAENEDALNFSSGKQIDEKDTRQIQPSEHLHTASIPVCGIQPASLPVCDIHTASIPVCGIQPASLPVCSSQNTEVDSCTVMSFVSERDKVSNLLEDEDNTKKTLSPKIKLGGLKNEVRVDVVTENNDREQYLFKLISAVRLFTIGPVYLESVLKQEQLIWSCREAYNVVLDALKYTLDVRRRHDTWPPAAVHRVSSSMRHVMAYVSDKKLMAYDLNSQRKYAFGTLPDKFSALKAATVFDNTLCVMYDTKGGQRLLSKYVFERRWEVVNTINKYDHLMLIALSQCVFSLCHKKTKKLNDFLLKRSHCKYSNSSSWHTCCNLNAKVDNLISFNQYVLAFHTTKTVIHVQAYHIQTRDTDSCIATMTGKSKGMISFTCEEERFILQRDGSFWKIVGTDADNLQFELISKLWSYDCDIKGCVLYQHTLFVFYSGDDQQEVALSASSVDNVFETIRTIQVRTDSPCLPMVIPESWQDTPKI